MEKKNYIAIKDVNEFIIRINKIKGYENYGLCFTNMINPKIQNIKSQYIKNWIRIKK